MRLTKQAGLVGLVLGAMMISAVGRAGELSGALTWGDRLALGTLVSGVVATVGVEAGQRVSKGDLLVSLDDRLFKARLAAAQAAFDFAKAKLAEARRENQRSAEMYNRTLLSDHERKIAEIALSGAESVAAKARANLVRARLRLSYSQLRAPVSGVVLAVHAAAGQAVVNRLQSQVLVTLASDARMRLQAQADAATADAVAGAGKWEVEVSGRRLAVTRVLVGEAPVAKGQSGPLYRVSAVFKRPSDLPLRAGAPARLTW